MSVTAIQNPLQPTDVLLFYPTSKGNLALEHRPFPTGSNTAAFSDNGYSPGPVMTDTSVAAVNHTNDAIVYGIIQWPSTIVGAQPNRAVAMLSPVINPLELVTNSVSLASISPGNYTALSASTDGSNNDFVYFLQDPTGETNQPLIWECVVRPDGSTSFLDLDSCPVNKLSNLAACYDPQTQKRHIIYQSPKGPLSWANMVDKNPVTIPNTTSAKIGTPLTVATAVGPNNELTIFLYFVDNQLNLNKAIHMPGKDEDKWIFTGQVGTSNPVNLNSGLAVVPDTNAQVNHVYYLQGAGDTFSSYPDPFFSSSESK